MTLLEVIISMLLLSILMISVAFSGTIVLLAVKNRVDASSTYVLAMNKAQALVASKGESFANSATFNVTNNVINYLEAVTGSDGFTLKPATIDFKKELNDAGVSNVTVAVTTSATDPNIVVVSLSTVEAIFVVLLEPQPLVRFRCYFLQFHFSPQLRLQQ